MAKKRVDYPDDDTIYAQLMAALAEYGRHARAEQWREAAVTAFTAERLAQRLTDEVLERFDAEHPRQRRSIATEMGITHGSVNYRIARAQTNGEQS